MWDLFINSSLEDSFVNSLQRTPIILQLQRINLRQSLPIEFDRSNRCQCEMIELLNRIYYLSIDHPQTNRIGLLFYQISNNSTDYKAMIRSYEDTVVKSQLIPYLKIPCNESDLLKYTAQLVHGGVDFRSVRYTKRQYYDISTMSNICFWYYVISI